MQRTSSRLQAEIKQTKPFPSIYQEALLSVLKTADTLRRNASKLLEAEQITMQQYNVLRILRGAGESGLPVLSIAERLIEETPGMTRLIDRLEAKDLVRRERCKIDRRQVFCKITPEGLDQLKKLDPIMDSQQLRLTDHISAADAEHLVRTLELVRESMDACPK